MTPFLRQIAQYFHSKGNMQDYCFVMPNHRSCKFLERELDITAPGAYIMPEIMPIDEMVERLSGGIPVNTIDALFILYNCYTSIAGNEDYQFDKFVYWGNVLLNDFNDVDMYLVDPVKIFNNVRELREIQANYFDKDLQEIIRHFFNVSDEGQAALNDDFWRKNYNDTSSDNEQVRANYLRLWQSMLQLYNDYNRELESRGLKSKGRIYRDAVDAVKDGKDLGHKTYAFVGFNMLSTSEMAIFKRLSNQGKACFFWDTASPVFSNKFQTNNGLRFIKFFQQQLPQPHDFITEPINSFPKIEVWGIPSNVGQTKCAFSIIDKMADNNLIADRLNAIDTAIVLPDESLFLPMLNSLTPKVPNINVTMGYPLRNSDIASLMRVVAKMHRQARPDANGTWGFYRNDVKVLMSHPIIKACYGQEALKLIHKIDTDNIFTVTHDMVSDMPFDMLFSTIDDINNPAAVAGFMRQLADFALKVRDKIAPHNNNINDDDDNNEAQATITLQEAFIVQYIDVLNRVAAAIEQHQVPPCENTIFFLVDKLAGVFSIPFEGEPLHGMQLMGMLETRCLDFDNIIILSANEKVLPRKFRASSFITDFMRRAYNMSTTSDQEAMWTYYFYRLISRAKRLYMLYDTSEQGMGTAEVTRFVHQLSMIYGCDIKHMQFTLPVPVSKEVKIEIPKTGHVATTINDFGNPSAKRRLSASSINEYINCPLAFYFKYIEDLNADNAEADFMDASEFGTIVHNTLQQLYYPDINGEKRTGQYVVTRNMINEFKQHHLDSVVCNMVNEVYTRNKNNNEPLRGEASIVSVAIKMFVNQALDYDINLLTSDNDAFTVLECEKKHHNVKLTLDGQSFFFNFTADRIDMHNGTMRMVDYKTGHDETSFENMDDLFSREDHRRKAILQLMLYCNAYAQENNYSLPIKPVIYTLSDMKKAGVKRKINKKVYDLENYLDINDEFKQRMAATMKSFFDTNHPFTQTTNIKPQTTPCRFCKFADFCRR